MATATTANGTGAAPSSLASPSIDRISISFPDAKNASLDDTFRVVGLNGIEEISQLYHYQLQLEADRAKPIAFDQFLGQRVTIQIPMPGKTTRPVSGIISLLTQERSDQKHTHYRADVVPRLWLLTKIAQSRIFQDLDALEIITKVLATVPAGFLYTVEAQGKYPQRPYCVQYREADFNFLSRLMEEEGIYYYFRQESGQEVLVIADAPLHHPDLPQLASAKLDEVGGGNRPEDRITDWKKTQELRAGKYTLWDHSFELPGKHLEADKSPVPKVSVRSALHRFDTPFGKDLEIYDYPGDYAERFDGVNRGGGDQSAKLQGVFQDNQRTVNIRMQQEALPGLIIHGASTCRQFQAGYQFTLEAQDPVKPAGWKPEGQFLLTVVHHWATQSFNRSGNARAFAYHNRFSCIPVDLPFRPLQRTAKPTIQGTQTAVVVGSGAKGEEIFTDKFGRVKVRFHWDRRDPKSNPDSCWIRVAQAWAGKRWGTSFWPRIGQEVVVAFEEGDPDRPIIIGSVYNYEQMPPYLGDGFDPKHKNDNKVSGIKSSSTPGGQGYNELRFDDTKDKEQVFIHAERNLDVRVKGSSMTSVGGSINITNGGVAEDGTKYGDSRQLVNKDLHLKVKGDSMVTTDGTESHIVQGDAFDWYTMSHRTSVFNEEFLEAATIIVEGSEKISLKAPKIILDAGQSISLKVGGNFIVIDATGVSVVGTPQIRLNSGGGPAESAVASSGIGQGDISNKAKGPQAPAGADNSRSGLRSNP